LETWLVFPNGERRSSMFFVGRAPRGSKDENGTRTTAEPSRKTTHTWKLMASPSCALLSAEAD